MINWLAPDVPSMWVSTTCPPHQDTVPSTSKTLLIGSLIKDARPFSYCIRTKTRSVLLMFQSMRPDVRVSSLGRLRFVQKDRAQGTVTPKPVVGSEKPVQPRG